MSRRYIGGYVSYTYRAVFTPYKGVWTLTAQMQAKQAGTWA
jgi:hypothetical protein